MAPEPHYLIDDEPFLHKQQQQLDRTNPRFIRLRSIISATLSKTFIQRNNVWPIKSPNELSLLRIREMAEVVFTEPSCSIVVCGPTDHTRCGCQCQPRPNGGNNNDGALDFFFLSCLFCSSFSHFYIEHMFVFAQTQ